MRAVLLGLSLLVTAASLPGCGENYEPCAGKACGDACRVCPPDAADCVETMELKACDAAGRCVSRTPDLACPQ